MNGSAHIMNDEATRKYLQAVKRLLTFLQRAYPTDPSRSVDFDGFRDAGLGAKGAGSDKAVSRPGPFATHLACPCCPLLVAQRGENSQRLAPIHVKLRGWQASGVQLLDWEVDCNGLAADLTV